MTARRIQLWLEQEFDAEPDQPQASSGPALSRQEAEVLRRLAKGQKPADIATSLSMGETAVKEHIKSLFYKASARTMPDR
jgi:DNA-binding NarL/FixJ family response regulator